MKYLFLIIVLLSIYICAYSCAVEDVDTFSRISGKESEFSDLFEEVLHIDSRRELSNSDILLVHPGWSPVTPRGDIIFPDEERLKVYDKNGNPVRIIGRPGQGPGEFDRRLRVYAGPKDYLIAVSGLGAKGLQYFDTYNPEYRFISKTVLRSNAALEDLLSEYHLSFNEVQNVSKAVLIDSTTVIYHIRLLGNNHAYSMIIQEKEGSCRCPYFTIEPGYTVSEEITHWGLYLGNFLWEMNPDYKIVYINTDEDKYSGNLCVFTINVLDIRSGITESFSDSLQIIEFDAELSFFTPDFWSHFNNNTRRRMVSLYKEKKYFPSIKHMFLDGAFLFVYPNTTQDFDPINADNKDREVRVYNINTKRRVNIVNFPFVFPNIQYGHAYYLDNIDGFPQYYKYKINPTVYGLPEDPEWRSK